MHGTIIYNLEKKYNSRHTERGEWLSSPANYISFTKVKHGCVRSETGWATLQINDQKTAHSAVFRKGRYTRGPMPRCGMRSRPKLAEKASCNSLLKIK